MNSSDDQIRASTKSRMKPRHAAALAPVGWYLMMPLIMFGVIQMSG